MLLEEIAKSFEQINVHVPNYERNGVFCKAIYSTLLIKVPVINYVDKAFS